VGGTDRDVANQMIEDELDIIFELGGSTHLNRISVLAYRVAPIQASWLGYPNSIGLPTIDYILVDPYLKPAPDLLIEKPFEMPHSWVSLSRLGFHDGDEINPLPPVQRNGYVTFGTANNPMKYTPGLLALWARVMNEVPGSRFLFIRPEGDVPAFRKHVLAAFAVGGIGAERIAFRPIRGLHKPHYNDIDISLDCIPHTGGTTTCEALWMGVPVVTRIGEAFYERLSYSNLANAGLKDLCAETEDDYVNVAVDLANDPAGIANIRNSLRGHIKASPLGDTVGWVRDWQDVIRSLVKGRGAP
jgi:predicted O-linked N-acetylglucosamine transferase (SPINDLY family)